MGQRAIALAQKYGMKTAGIAEIEKKVEVVEVEGSFDETIEINDFPPEARFQLTRKEHISEVADRSGCAITTRGSYVAKGEKKLSLFLEATTEKCIQKAKMIIEKILKDELHREATTFQGRGAQQGRYNPLALTGSAPRGGYGQLGWR